MLLIRLTRGRRIDHMSHYEQPDYSTVASHPDYEIRLYQPYLVAETTARGDFRSTGNTAFRRLARFTFGRNSEGLRMNMTIPVTHHPMKEGLHKYRFVMERAYSEDSLPRPLDDAVAIVRVPAGYFAALSYRGGRNERRYRRSEAALLASLERDGIAVVGEPAAAVYNGPATPPLLRRNEVLVPIDWSAQSTA